jgi:hypothetical protein
MLLQLFLQIPCKNNKLKKVLESDCWV